MQINRRLALGILSRVTRVFVPALLLFVVMSGSCTEGVCAKEPQKQVLYEEGPDEREVHGWDLLVLGAAVLVILGGIVFKIRRTLKRWYRIRWQERAEEEEAPQACQPGSRYCHRMEIRPAPRRIVHLTLVEGGAVSGEQARVAQVKGEIVDVLNRAVSAYRQGDDPEKTRALVASLARGLLERMYRRSSGRHAPGDVSFIGHLEGRRVVCQFILYHCRLRGGASVWEEEDRWKATFKDERDEPIGTFRSRDLTGPGMAERLAPDMTRMLLQLVERVCLLSGGFGFRKPRDAV